MPKSPKQKRINHKQSGEFGATGRRQGRKTAAESGMPYPAAWKITAKPQ